MTKLLALSLLLLIASCGTIDPTYYPYKCTVDMKLKGEC